MEFQEGFMKVLLTGAAGFVGGHLAKHLLKDGHAVRRFARPAKDTSVLEQLGVEIARALTVRSGDCRIARTFPFLEYFMAATLHIWAWRFCVTSHES